jgi:hypothetical protein
VSPQAVRSGRWILLAAALAVASCTRDGASPPPDRDGDGIVAAYDCDDADATVHATVTAYPDADGDGVGAGTAASFCTGGAAPAGHALDATDCAPGDPAAWRTLDLVDRDGDGFTVQEAMTACAGAAVPDPYRETAAGNDCDDGDPALSRWAVAYRDQDGDGVGARPRSILCVGAALPSGWSPAGYDVDDSNPAVASDPAGDDLALLLD